MFTRCSYLKFVRPFNMFYVSLASRPYTYIIRFIGFSSMRLCPTSTPSPRSPLGTDIKAFYTFIDACTLQRIFREWRVCVTGVLREFRELYRVRSIGNINMSNDSIRMCGFFFSRFFVLFFLFCFCRDPFFSILVVFHEDEFCGFIMRPN